MDDRLRTAPRTDERSCGPGRPTRRWHDVGEEVLLKLAIDGCDQAWHELVRRYGGLVKRVATRTGLTSSDASDACQATWIRLLEHADSIREPRALAGWLATTARRESIRISMRAGRERPGSDLDTAAVAPSAEVAALEHELEGRLASALDDLEPHHRRLLLLLLSDEGLSYAEIARNQGMPIGSIGPMRGRSLLVLRQRLDLSMSA